MATIIAGRLRATGKADLNAAVAANHVPRAGAGGVGLSVQIPGARSRILVNKNGQLTAAGAYYYDQVGQEPPASGFDYNQQATRSGQRMVIRLLDGTTRAVQVWDTRTNAFRPTVLGKKFLARALDKYTVSFPVLVNVTRTNGSIYQRQDWLPSTALPLGEIEVPRAMTEADCGGEAQGGDVLAHATIRLHRSHGDPHDQDPLTGERQRSRESFGHLQND